MIRTYIDSGVLIAAARGSGQLADRALKIITDNTTRDFVSSDYVRSETVPKPTFFGREEEVHFYEQFFSRVTIWIPFDKVHLESAFQEACRTGLSRVDAIHVVVAELSGCEELVTSEKLSSAIHRTTRVHIVSIDA
ncbi:MAG: type II toxin-antitoxin system VapC family toxin [Candidatus Solibacter usitatus]|nr:type II toxin-antitoxin system VapC family toxin [Candidatus Solibacter usitatus]